MYCENPIIIIEGKSFTKNSSIAIKLESIKGALITLAQTFRIPVIRTTDEVDTAWYINQMSLQRARVGVNKGPITAHKPQKPESRKEYILKAFPGIGHKTAKALLEEFGSITNIVNASEKELQKVHGLGPKTVKAIQNVVKEERGVYISQSEI
jgi:ERCC4-type nuclease